MVSSCRETCRGVHRKRALPAAIWKFAGKSKFGLDNSRLVGWLRFDYFLVKEQSIASLRSTPRPFSSYQTLDPVINLNLSPTTTMTTNGNVITCATPDFSKREKFGVLFGHPIAHSYSPMMHQTVYDNIGYDWQQFLLESTDMSQFLALRQHPQFYGKSPRTGFSTQVANNPSRRGCHNATQSRNPFTSR
jgi:hypothetical protein